MLLPQKDLVQRNNHLVISQMQRKKKSICLFLSISAPLTRLCHQRKRRKNKKKETKKRKKIFFDSKCDRSV
jgi:hypothetical protein